MSRPPLVARTQLATTVQLPRRRRSRRPRRHHGDRPLRPIRGRPDRDGDGVRWAAV